MLSDDKLIEQIKAGDEQKKLYELYDYKEENRNSQQ